MISTAIDFFCGSGGFSTGARQAGVTVAAAANHWPQAVAIHELNHPDTQHFCQDLQIADLTKFPAHDLFLGSPACQGHSRAKGKGKDDAHHDTQRATAWVVVNALEVHRPQNFIIENVPEFRDWVLFPQWMSCLEALGYKVTTQVMNAADFGVPQARRRTFVVGDLTEAITLVNPKMPHVPARSIIDWDKGDWKPISSADRHAQGLRPLVDNTLRRIAIGREELGDRFYVALYGTARGGKSLDKPLGTVTTSNHYLLVKGDEYRLLSIDENRRAMGFPDDYILPSNSAAALKMLGNAVPVQLAEGVIRQVLTQRALRTLPQAALAA